MDFHFGLKVDLVDLREDVLFLAYVGVISVFGVGGFETDELVKNTVSSLRDFGLVVHFCWWDKWV